MYLEQQTFENIDFVGEALGEEYDGCTFVNCNFMGADLLKLSFTDCIFKGCNLSNVPLAGTAFAEARFEECKLLGLHFEDCSQFLFSVKFDNCILNFSSFYNLKLKKTLFKDSEIREADFTGADLTDVIFEHCDLKDTRFENSILINTDLRTAQNYSIDPETNKIKGARFSVPAVLGLLHKYDIEVSW